MKQVLPTTKLLFILLFIFLVQSCEIEPIGSNDVVTEEIVDEVNESTEESGEGNNSETENTSEETTDDSMEEPATEEPATEETENPEDEAEMIEDPLMQATIAGIRYDEMMPFGYPFTSAVSVYEPYGDERYLVVQGFAGVLNGSHVQLEFRIKEQFWVAGTHDLVGGDLDNTVGVYIIINDRPGEENSIIDYEGNFTITSFDIENRRVQGTFEFPFRFAPVGAVEYEIYEITEGTFDYPLDDEAFEF